jgi:mono/diheme cytochrome c family protein
MNPLEGNHAMKHLLAALAVAAGLLMPQARAETPLERGTYLMRGIAACGNCHTPKAADGTPIAGQELAGGFVIEAPVFRAVASNITPDRETGIGAWSDREIIDAIRNGRRPDGRLLGPPMPFENYRRMSDADVAAIVAYLRAVRPVTNRVEPSTFNVPLPASYGPTVTRVPAPPKSNRIAYGRYLSEVGHCMDCHTPLVRGRLDTTRIGAGGREFPAIPAGTVVAANLTPANPDGIVKWTDAEVATAIRQGVRPDGRRLVPLMAFDWYRHINDEDMIALVAFLRTLPPTKS